MLEKSLLTTAEKRLLHLLGVRALWPYAGTREEFPVELKLMRALEEALKQVDAENAVKDGCDCGYPHCKHCGVVNPTYKDGRCSDCGEPSK